MEIGILVKRNIFVWGDLTRFRKTEATVRMELVLQARRTKFMEVRANVAP
jgi:hypothetical protein